MIITAIPTTTWRPKTGTSGYAAKARFQQTLFRTLGQQFLMRRFIYEPPALALIAAVMAFYNVYADRYYQYGQCRLPSAGGH
jgi:hypothetical protein